MGALYKTLHGARRKLRGHLTKQGLAGPGRGPPEWDATSATPITGTLRRLLGPGEPEVTREVCFAQLDRYVDAKVLGQDADAAVPGMRAHLAGCPDEHENLKALVTSE